MESRDAAEDGTLSPGDGRRARFLPGEGHLLVIDHMAELVEVLQQAAPPR